MRTGTLIYDGQCSFCQCQAARAERLTGDRLTLESFRDPGVLERHPGLTREACERAMQFIDSEGWHTSAAQAAAEILRLNPWLAWIGWLYYLPGISVICEFIYRWVARNRFRLGGNCALHR